MEFLSGTKSFYRSDVMWWGGAQKNHVWVISVSSQSSSTVATLRHQAFSKDYTNHKVPYDENRLIHGDFDVGEERKDDYDIPVE